MKLPHPARPPHSWFDEVAQSIFGECGCAYRTLEEGKPVCKVGFRSRYGFHVRGTADTEEGARLAALRARLPDDPTPTDPSWVPSSYSAPFDPYSKPASPAGAAA